MDMLVDILPFLMFAVLVPLLFSGYPVAFVLGGTGLAFWLFAVAIGLENGNSFFLVVSRIYGGVVAKPLLVAIPMFIYMGTVLERSGIARDLLVSMQLLTRRIPGGLALSVTIIGVVLAATTGIIGASVVMLTLMALPVMLEARYDPGLAAGTIAASGTLGILLPPSIMLVVMADLLGTSAGGLFMAAIGPSLLLALFYAAYIIVRTLITPSLAPKAETIAAKIAAKLTNPDATARGPEIADSPQTENAPQHGTADDRENSTQDGAENTPARTPETTDTDGTINMPENTAENSTEDGSENTPSGTPKLMPDSANSDDAMRAGFSASASASIRASESVTATSPQTSALSTGNTSIFPDNDPLYSASLSASNSGGIEALAETPPILLFIKSFFPPVMLIALVLGSIFGGVATPTEASGIGAFGATVLALLRGKLTLPVYQNILEKSALTTAMLFGLFIGATAFSYVFSLLGGHDAILHFINVTDTNPWAILTILMVLVFILGFFFDWIEITLIVLPVFAPVIAKLDFAGHLVDSADVITWFAVLMAVNLQTSFLTPPFGFALFYLKGAAGNMIKLQQIYKGIIPFVVLQLLALAALLLWPDIALYLPRALG